MLYKQKIISKDFSGNRQLLDKGIAVQQLVLNNKPGFLIRWGITIFLLILVFIIIAAWFIQYPDVVTAKARLTSLNAPKPVVAKSDGQLIRLYVKEGEIVEKNQVIGFMESTANPKIILDLSDILDSLQAALSNGSPEFITNHYATILIKSQNELGELQQFYQIFTQSAVLFRTYLSNGFYLRKKSMLVKDMGTLRKLNENLKEQKDLQEENLSLARQTFSANEQLKNDSIISIFDYRNESSKLISKKLSVPQINSSIISNEGQQNGKRKEILELENEMVQQKNIFIQSLNTFISQVKEWKKKYVLVSPVEGKISFSMFIQEHQQLYANQIVCYVNPNDSQYYIELYIPQFNLGKIKPGQQVFLQFPSYPYQEYGSLKGTIEFISTIPTDSGYLAKVSLSNGLVTTYKKSIQYMEGLIAEGKIITRNMRLLQRFYNSILNQVKSNSE